MERGIFYKDGSFKILHNIPPPDNIIVSRDTSKVDVLQYIEPITGELKNILLYTYGEHGEKFIIREV